MAGHRHNQRLNEPNGLMWREGEAVGGGSSGRALDGRRRRGGGLGLGLDLLRRDLRGECVIGEANR